MLLKGILLLSFQENRHIRPCRGTWESTRFHQEAEVVRGMHGLYTFSHRKEGTRQVKQ